MLRTIKIRSVENAEYKPSYNRMRFDIASDDMSTDLSKSYLALQLWICNPDGSKLTNANIKSLTQYRINISFGRNGEAYTPASLIKVARLWSKANQSSPLEEVQYSNIITALLHQLKNDFETLQSSSLLTNSTTTFNTNSSLASAVATSFDTPIEVHIPLGEIFGVCKSTNFWLSEHPLMIELELEDVKKLFQQTVSNENVAMYPKTVLDIGNHATRGYLPSPSSNTCFQQIQNLYSLTSALLPPAGETTKPKSWVYRSDYWMPFFGNQVADTGVNKITLVSTIAWSVANMTALGFVQYAPMQLNFVINQPNQNPKIWSRMVVISGTTPATGAPTGAFITFDEFIVLPTYVGLLTGTTVQLDSVELFNDVSILSNYSNGAWNGLVNADTVAGLHDVDIQGLQALGILYGGAVSTAPTATGNPFTLSVRLKTVATGAVPNAGANGRYVYVYPDIYSNPDVPNARALYSNTTKKLPVQSGGARVIKTTYNAQDDTDLTLQTLGLTNNNSLQFSLIVPTAGTNVPIVATGGSNGASVFDVFIYNTKAQFPNSFISNVDYTYSITKAEVVLVQSEKDPELHPSSIYTTFKCEVATIENQQLQEYNRQFIVSEPNVYNLWLCMPQYSTSSDGRFPESLISHARGVNSFRWSVNNVDDTNRNLTLMTNKSSYPSSLYLDKLMDCFKNSNEKLHSLSGINSVARSIDPVCFLPLKVYKGSDEQNHYLNPQTFQAQIAMYGDTTHNMSIQVGGIFLFKEMIKEMPL
jgi:hypothetical protein